jgi:hypothetical protein
MVYGVEGQAREVEFEFFFIDNVFGFDCAAYPTADKASFGCDQ